MRDKSVTKYVIAYYLLKVCYRILSSQSMLWLIIFSKYVIEYYHLKVCYKVRYITLSRYGANRPNMIRVLPDLPTVLFSFLVLIVLILWLFSEPWVNQIWSSGSLDCRWRAPLGEDSWVNGVFRVEPGCGGRQQAVCWYGPRLVP